MESLDPNLLKYSLIEPSTAVFTIPEDLGKYQVGYSVGEQFSLSLAFGNITLINAPCSKDWNIVKIRSNLSVVF